MGHWRSRSKTESQREKRYQWDCEGFTNRVGEFREWWEFSNFNHKEEDGTLSGSEPVFKPEPGDETL